MSAHFQRGYLLFQQGLYQKATEELRKGLAQDPDHAFSHTILSLCLNDLNQHEEATREAELAIGLAPDESLGHFALAKSLFSRNRFAESETAINHAIAHDPGVASYRFVLGMLRYQKSDWKGTLEQAELGLGIDPEDQSCRNLKGMALVKLGRKDEASQLLEGALENDPEDAFTHANQGWNELHAGRPEKALIHFQEALRREPDFEYARLGMIEAIKARYWLYRVFLGYLLWMERLSSSARWGIIIGLIVLQRVARQVSDDNPALAPFIDFGLAAYICFVIFTWIAKPVGNLLLRLTRLGNLALNPAERSEANWVGFFLGLALISLIPYAIRYPFLDIIGFRMAFQWLWLIPAITFARHCDPGWPSWVMNFVVLIMVTLVVGGLGLCVAGLWLFFEGNREDFSTWVIRGFNLWNLNLIVGFINIFLGSYLTSVQVKK